MINLQKYNINLQQPVRYGAGCFLFLVSLLTFSASAYERIVSATGNASEIIAELGLADKLIAVDTTSTLPVTVMADKSKIGYRRALSSEGILSMQPDLLILAPDAGPPTVLAQLQAAKLPSLTLSDVKTTDGVIADIRKLAEKLDVVESAKPLIQRIRDDEAEINTLIADYPRLPKMVFLMDGGTGQNRLMALGAETAGDAMLTLVGGKNIYAEEFKSIKPVSSESMISSDMDMIVIAAHGDGVKVAEQLENATADYANLALTKAGKNDCIFRIGTVQALGFGPSFSAAAKAIAKAVKPCLSKTDNN